MNFRPGSNLSPKGLKSMTQADRVHSTPPTNTSAIDDPQSTIERPMPCADSPDSIFLQPAIGQPDSENLTGDSPSPTEGLDRALLRFVRCLVSYGATPDEIHAMVLADLERARQGAEKMRRQMLRRSQLQLVEVRQ